MAIAGSSRPFDAEYLPFGETSAAMPNTGLVGSDEDPFPATYVGNVEKPAWWKFKADATGWVRLDTELSTATGYLDTLIVVWWRDPVTGFYEQVAIDDDSGTGPQADSAVTFRAGVDATYYIQVMSWIDAGNTTTYVLRAGVGTPVLPRYGFSGAIPTPSDSFAGAPAADFGGNVTTDLSGYGVEAGEVLDTTWSTPDTRSAWWKFTPEASGLVNFYTTKGQLAVFTGSSLATLDLVQMRWNSGDSQMTTLYVYLTAGETYHLRWSNALASTLTAVNVGISNMIPAVLTTIPFTNTRQRRFGNGTYNTGPGQLVGGTTALQDASDSTFIDVYAPINNSQGGFREYVVDIAATTFDSPILDIQVRLRGAVDAGAPFQSNAAVTFNFIEIRGSSSFYGSFDWRWKPTELRDRIISLRSASGGLAVNDAMIADGPWYDNATSYPAHYPPNGWGYQEPTLFTSSGASGFGYARITEGELRVYTFDGDSVPVKPPDLVMAIAGQLDRTRVRFL